MSDFYQILLNAMCEDVGACLRMLEDIPRTAHVKSSLRRALTDVKEAIRSYENE